MECTYEDISMRLWIQKYSVQACLFSKAVQAENASGSVSFFTFVLHRIQIERVIDSWSEKDATARRYRADGASRFSL